MLGREPPGSIRGEDAVVRQDADGIVIGDKASIATSRPAEGPPKSAEELEQAMRRMGRDPITGEPTGPEWGAREGGAPGMEDEVERTAE